jgi:hypothetical protein
MYEMDHRFCGLYWGTAGCSACAADAAYVELDAFKKVAHMDRKIVELF